MTTTVLTVTLNPALDLSACVPQMEAGPKLRLSDPVLEPGGGGVNVARVIHVLGGDVTAWVALGGANGAQHLALMRKLGLSVRSFECPGETRQNWAVTDAHGQQFRLQLPGPDWSADTGAAAIADIVAQPAGLVVLSGSQPPGLDMRFPQILAARLGAGRLVLDTSGAALEQVLARPEAPLHVLRLDQAEAEAQAGRAMPDAQDTARFAASLRAQGVAEMVAIARGADGNVLACREGLFHCRPPQVPVASKIGAGDSFTGAFALALAKGQPACDALRLGTAAAAATVMSAGTELCSAADVMRLHPECTLTRLDP